MKVVNMSKARKWTLFIDIVGTGAVIALFALWILHDNAVNLAGRCAAVVSTVLFVLVCYHFVGNWIRRWDSKTIPEAVASEAASDRKTSLFIFLVFLIYDVLVLFAIHFIRVFLFGDTTDFREGLELFLEIDTGYYLDIAEFWYGNSSLGIVPLVFYPGYPLLIRAFNVLFHNYLISAVVCSGILYAFSAVILYKLLALDYSGKAALRGVKYLAILPAAFFFSAPMSESLFLFLSLLCVYLARKERWLTACVIGALSAFTRSLGVLVFAPLAFAAITGIIREESSRKKWIVRLIMTLIVPLGTAAYLLVNYTVTGDAFAFSKLEQGVWGQSMGLFFDSIASQTDNALADIQQPYFTIALGQWIPNVAYCLGSLLVMVFASKKIRAEYSLWFICYFFLAIGVTYLLSAPRYLAACLPIYPALVQLTENKKTDTALTVICAACAAFYLFAFAARWEVY